MKFRHIAIALLSLISGLLIHAPTIALSQYEASVCPLPDEAGVWINTNQAFGKGVISQVEIEHRCDQFQKEIWTIRVKVHCHPRDCTWGYTRGEVIQNALFALYRNFSATQLVKIQTAENQLKVELYSKFISGKREDKRQNFILERRQ